MARKALIVGIDRYLNVSCLGGCENDATAVAQLLSLNADGTPNYNCRTIVASVTNNTIVGRTDLRAACRDLFEGAFRGEVLLYFSGHGAVVGTKTYLATSDGVVNDYGVSMDEILEMACNSSASDILIIFDCCHSGGMGNHPLFQLGNHALSILRDNMTIMAASLPSELAMESGGHGAFTRSLLDALDGGAADHLGWVTAPAIYSFIERRFDSWSQRPMYKANASTVTTVRECAPLIERRELQEMVNLFPTASFRLRLDPQFEPEDEHGNMREPVDVAKVRVAGLLKTYRDVGLLRACVQGEQFYWTARRSHEVELTLRGKEYWRLVKNHRI